MEFINTFDKHTKEPNKSLEAYSKEKHLELGSYLHPKKIVYLDTKYWIKLRDASLGSALEGDDDELLVTISRLVDNGVCIFPISENTFIEVMKQCDPNSIKATARLIDKFSGGISLLGLEGRTYLELSHYIYKNLRQPVYETEKLVWTKLAYVMGFVSPNLGGVDPADQTLISKAFFDQMWAVSLVDMLEIMGPVDQEMLFEDRESFIRQMNRDQIKYKHENKSFKQMFMSEIAGLIDVNKDIIAEVINNIDRKTFDAAFQEMSVGDGKLAGNMIYNLFRLNKINTELPSFKIMSGLYAAVRWDKKQKFKKNDMHDFGHAAAALPYCDYFFTERPLTSLITQNMLAYDKLYNCNVQWKVGSVLDALNALE